MERLQTLIGSTNDINSFLNYVIKFYRKYNTLLPKELYDIITKDTDMLVDKIIDDKIFAIIESITDKITRIIR